MRRVVWPLWNTWVLHLSDPCLRRAWRVIRRQTSHLEVWRRPWYVRSARVPRGRLERHSGEASTWVVDDQDEPMILLEVASVGPDGRGIVAEVGITESGRLVHERESGVLVLGASLWP